MPRIASPYVLHPVMQYRFMVNSSKLPGIQLYGRSATLPTVNNSPVRLDHGNGYVKIKGKTEWEDITIECYHFEGITNPTTWAYMQKHQWVTGAVDDYPSAGQSYKHDIQLLLLNPMQIPIGTWILNDAFFSSVSWGSMDWGGSDINKVTLTISYDYANYLGI